MDKLSSLSGVRRISEHHNFRASKSLGQNFLTDPEAVSGIVDGSDIGPDDLVIEIGPGMGVLTCEAAQQAGQLIAIELDSKLKPILAKTLAPYENASVHWGDVMKTDIRALIAEAKAKAAESGAPGTGSGLSGNVRVIGNLPYYITTPIIMKLLEDRLPITSITIMMQKEVADRIVANPGGRTYGAISVAVQYYCNVHRILEVPKESFYPMPQVDSTVLRLDLRETPGAQPESEADFFTTVKAAFSQRRKTLSNSLGALGLPKDQIGALLAEAGIEPVRRAETLSLEEFAALSNAYTRCKAENR